MAFSAGANGQKRKDWISMKTKIIFSMVLAATIVIGVGSAAYAEGEDGITAAGQAWQAANGSASVPVTEWYAASAAQRAQLSHQYDGGSYPTQANNGRGRTYSVLGH
jgi:hypothetical protein